MSKAGDAKFLRWIADRLVKVHRENPDADFVLRLREIASDIEASKMSAPVRRSTLPGGLTIGELRWLAAQVDPVWGGHIARGEPTPDPFKAMMAVGLIQLHPSGNGYMIGPAGRTALQTQEGSHG